MCSQWVPIPILKQKCEKQCCEIEFIPLTLAYGKTAHTFQGQSAGPGHPVQSIVVQPGTRQFEGTCPGLFYVMLSRATTIGKSPDHSDSAIFFHTNEMNYDRITNLYQNKSTNTPFKKVIDRNKWIQHLQRNRPKLSFGNHKKNSLIQWATTTRITQNQLTDKIHEISWRTSDTINY